MFWKILVVLGILGVILGFLITAVSVALPQATDGRVSWDEAAYGIVPGVIIWVLSLFVFLVGLIVVLLNRRTRRKDNSK